MERRAGDGDVDGAQALRSTAAGIYGMVHALRPQGKDWQAYQAVRPRAHHERGRFDEKGPYPNDILEIQIGSGRAARASGLS